MKLSIETYRTITVKEDKTDVEIYLPDEVYLYQRFNFKEFTCIIPLSLTETSEIYSYKFIRINKGICKSSVILGNIELNSVEDLYNSKNNSLEKEIIEELQGDDFTRSESADKFKAMLNEITLENINFMDYGRPS